MRDGGLSYVQIAPTRTNSLTGTFKFFALSAEGAVYAWDSLTNAAPVGGLGVAGVYRNSELVSSGYHVCTANNDGAATCSGVNNVSQVSSVASFFLDTPGVGQGRRFDRFTLRGGNTCAILMPNVGAPVSPSGDLVCWGKVGGSTRAATDPKIVLPFPNATRVSTSDDHACMISENGGKVFCNLS